MKVHLELVEGSSAKFWALELAGKAFTVRYGRIGTAGQAQEKSFASPPTAKAAAEKLIAEKRKKGYAEPAGKAGPAKAAKPAQVAEPAKAAKAAKTARTAKDAVFAGLAPDAEHFEDFVQGSTAALHDMTLRALLAGARATGSDGGGNVWHQSASPASGHLYRYCIDHETGTGFGTTWPDELYQKVADADGEIDRDLEEDDDALAKLRARALKGRDAAATDREATLARAAWDRTAWLRDVLRGKVGAAPAPDAQDEDWDGERVAAGFADSGAGALYWGLALWIRGDARAAEAARLAAGSSVPILRSGAAVVAELVAGTRTNLAGVNLVKGRAAWAKAHAAWQQAGAARAAQEHAAAEQQAHAAAARDAAGASEDARIRYLRVGFGDDHPVLRLGIARFAGVRKLLAWQPVPGLSALRELVDVEWPAEGLDELSACGKLRRLVLSGSEGDKAKLPAKMAALATLETLELEKLAGLTLPAGARLPALRRLVVRECKLDAATWQALLSSPALEEVDVEDVKDLSPLVAARGLRSLRVITDQKKLPKGLAELTTLTSLRLGVNGVALEPCAAVAAKLTHLDSLVIEGWAAGDEMPDVFASLGHLRALRINARGRALPASVAALPLRRLEIDGPAPGFEQVLMGMKALEELVVEGAQVRKPDGAWGGGPLPADVFKLALKRLRLSGFAPAWPKAAGKLAGVEELELSFIDGAELPAWLGKLPLRKLALLNSEGARSLVPALPHLTQLRSLVLDACSLERLPAKLPALEELVFLGESSCDDTEWKQLVAMKSLRRLTVDDEQRTQPPPGIAALAHLERLGLHKADLNDEQELALRRLLPEVEVAL